MQCLGALIWKGKLGILMELMSHGDLRDAIAHDRVVWGPKAMRIAQDISAGLSYLHNRSRPIAHCDLKSPNILLQYQETAAFCGFRAKICDCGLSHIISGSHLTVTTDTPYTFNWASPEQIDSGQLTCASDIFSFGVRPAGLPSLIWTNTA